VLRYIQIWHKWTSGGILSTYQDFLKFIGASDRAGRKSQGPTILPSMQVPVSDKFFCLCILFCTWNLDVLFCHVTENSRHFGTGTNRHLCETFRYQDKSAPGQFGTSIRQIKVVTRARVRFQKPGPKFVFSLLHLC
jgi:hypothetical protein